MKIRHKKEGWTGTIEVVNEEIDFTSSHRLGLTVQYIITQDTHKPDGTYVEDPYIGSLDELEFLDSQLSTIKKEG